MALGFLEGLYTLKVAYASVHQLLSTSGYKGRWRAVVNTVMNLQVS